MAVNSFNAQNPPVNTKGDLFTFSTIPTKLAVGSNNTVLTADSTTATGLKWATVSAGGMTLLASGTLSGSNVDLTSISGSYNDLRLVLTNFTTSSRGNIGVTFNGDTTASYNGVGVQNYQGIAASVVWNGFSGNYIWLNQNSNVGLVTNPRNINVLDIPNYTATDCFKVASERYYIVDNTGGSSQVIGNTSFWWGNTAAINRITLDPEGTRTWTGGNYYLYGVK